MFRLLRARCWMGVAYVCRQLCGAFGAAAMFALFRAQRLQLPK